LCAVHGKNDTARDMRPGITNLSRCKEDTALVVLITIISDIKY